jgi:hypothetical protein
LLSREKLLSIDKGATITTSIKADRRNPENIGGTSLTRRGGVDS